MTLDNVDNVTADMVRARIRWVEELRSGRYTQLAGALKSAKDPMNRCCLGVACDPVVTGIELKEKPVGRVIQFEDPNNRFDTESAGLPTVIMAALGLKSQLPAVAVTTGFGYEDHRLLSTLNDTGASFDRIADLIEENYVTPFLHLLEENTND